MWEECGGLGGATGIGGSAHQVLALMIFVHVALPDAKSKSRMWRHMLHDMYSHNVFCMTAGACLLTIDRPHTT